MRHELIRIDDRFEANPDMAALVADAREMSVDLEREVGQTPIALHRDTCLEAPMDHVLLAAVARAAGTEIAFSNGWRYGAPIPPGPVTVEDLWNIVPVNPPVSKVDLTGAEILEMMEHNLEHTFSCDPFGQMGGYVKRFRGLVLCVKLENPKGLRIDSAFAQDGPLERTRTYPVSFITQQGVPKHLGRNRRDLETHAVTALEDWFREPDRQEDGGVSGAGRFIVV